MLHKRQRNKKLFISERKLGRHNAYGLFWHKTRKIEVDPRLKSEKYLYVLIHELLHLCFPNMSETRVKKVGKIIAKGVWQ